MNALSCTPWALQALGLDADMLLSGLGVTLQLGMRASSSAVSAASGGQQGQGQGMLQQQAQALSAEYLWLDQLQSGGSVGASVCGG